MSISSVSTPTRGYTDVQDRDVTWHGVNARYSLAETEQLQGLPTREAFLIHSLKSVCGGEITPHVPAKATQSLSRATKPEVGLTTLPEGNRGAEAATSPQRVYTDPEDIPFGEEKNATRKRKRPIYANVWTPRRHRRHKTKKRCLEQQRVWKRWYERQGWKVSSHANGYFAAKDGERHAIVLHEYDAETRERLN